MQYQRVAVQRLVYHTQEYKRCKKTYNSHLKSSCGLHFVLDSVYELDVGSCFLMCGKLVCEQYPNVPYLHVCKQTTNNVVLLHPEKVWTMCIAMTVGHTLYVADMPNVYEQD